MATALVWDDDHAGEVDEGDLQSQAIIASASDRVLALSLPNVCVANQGTKRLPIRAHVETTEAACEDKDSTLRTADPAIELPLYEVLGK
jgi:hypothetical protein